MKPTPEINPIVVFTGTTWQAGMVKSMLEDAGNVPGSAITRLSGRQSLMVNTLL